MASIALTTSRWGKSNRLSSVAAKGYWFEYDYLENSTTDRLHKTRAPFIKETEWTYEPGRDTITSVINRVGFHLDQQFSQYTYENNADAQRTARTSKQAGQEWTEHFSYYPVTGGITASNPNTEARDPEAYQYDKIGNRVKATKGNITTKYEANALNQYSSISQPSSLISQRRNGTATEERDSNGGTGQQRRNGTSNGGTGQDDGINSLDDVTVG